MPRSLVEKVVRAVQAKAKGDQNGVSQGVMGTLAVVIWELINVMMATLSLPRVERKWMQILAELLVRVFHIRHEGCELFSTRCGGSGILATKVRFLPLVV